MVFSKHWGAEEGVQKRKIVTKPHSRALIAWIAQISREHSKQDFQVRSLPWLVEPVFCLAKDDLWSTYRLRAHTWWKCFACSDKESWVGWVSYSSVCSCRWQPKYPSVFLLSFATHLHATVEADLNSDCSKIFACISAENLHLGVTSSKVNDDIGAGWPEWLACLQSYCGVRSKFVLFGGKLIFLVFIDNAWVKLFVLCDNCSWQLFRENKPFAKWSQVPLRSRLGFHGTTSRNFQQNAQFLHLLIAESEWLFGLYPCRMRRRLGLYFVHLQVTELPTLRIYEYNVKYADPSQGLSFVERGEAWYKNL